jgi:oligopeptide transport system substrate-binding protein
MNMPGKYFFGVMVLLLLATCGPGQAAERIVHRGSIGDPATLDPHKFVDPWESTVVMDLFIGLTSLTRDAKVVPGLAAGWDLSEDGREYTFHLRPDLEWSDGEPLDASDFVFSFRRILDPATASPFAYRLAIIANAVKVISGELAPDQLGVSAPDAATVVIRLEEPAPWFPEILIHRGLPAPRHAIEKFGDAWIRPGRMVSNGAFKLSEWVPNSHVRLDRNPGFHDAENVRLDAIYHHPATDLATALRQFRAGELDVIVTFPADQLDWVRENLPDSLRLVPGLGMHHYVVNTTRPPFDDVRVRLALAAAIDRNILTEKVLGAGEVAAVGLVPPGVTNYPERASAEFAAWSRPERIEYARTQLAAAGFSAASPLEVRLSYDTSDLNRRVAVAVAAMWKQIGVRVQLENMEAKVLIANVRNGDFDVSRYLWLAETSDPLSFLERLHSQAGPLNQSGYSDAAFDELLDDARATVDTLERAALLKTAEARALSAMPVIPLHYHAGRRLVAPHVKGWGDNARGISLARDLWIDEERSESD